jgi:hypothetical protein
MTDLAPTGADLDPSTTEPDTTPLSAVRDLVLQANPNIVPELVTGDTLEDLLASIEPARAAYTRLADRLPTAPPTVPAGASTPAALDPERIPASLKIQLGLRQRTSQTR